VDFNIIENESSGIMIFFTDVVDEKVDEIGQILREKLKDCAQFHLLQSGNKIAETCTNPMTSYAIINIMATLKLDS